MTRFNLALAVTLATVLAGPALAQMTQPPPTTHTPAADTAQVPQADTAAPADTQAQTPVPDTGMKKTAPKHVHHRVHHRVHVKPADTATPPAPATQR